MAKVIAHPENSSINCFNDCYRKLVGKRAEVRQVNASFKEIEMTVQAIPTTYNGIEFRSRLEARWAVFFDALGIEYWYEYEGFKLPSGWYVPDFWLPNFRDYYSSDSGDLVETNGIWIEVKGQELTFLERQLAEELCELTQKMVYFLTPEILTAPPNSFEGTKGSFLNYWCEREPEHLFNQRIEVSSAIDRGQISLEEYEKFLEAYESEWQLSPRDILITADPEFKDPFSPFSPRLKNAYNNAKKYRFY